MKDDKRLKKPEEEKKVNYPDKNCIKLTLKKPIQKYKNSSEMNIEK